MDYLLIVSTLTADAKDVKDAKTAAGCMIGDFMSAIADHIAATVQALRGTDETKELAEEIEMTVLVERIAEADILLTNMNLHIEKITFPEPNPRTLDPVTNTNVQDRQQPQTPDMKLVEMRYPLKVFNPNIRRNGQEALGKPTLEMKVVGLICPLKDIHQLDLTTRQKLMLKLYQDGILQNQEKGEKIKMHLNSALNFAHLKLFTAVCRRLK